MSTVWRFVEKMLDLGIYGEEKKWATMNHKLSKGVTYSRFIEGKAVIRCLAHGVLLLYQELAGFVV
jgi:hypothetical protein